jgi:hypothetical protein
MMTTATSHPPTLQDHLPLQGQVTATLVCANCSDCFSSTQPSFPTKVIDVRCRHIIDEKSNSDNLLRSSMIYMILQEAKANAAKAQIQVVRMGIQ